MNRSQSTVARGLEPQLTVWPAWRDLQIGAPPDQLCLWSLAGNPYQMYLAAPLPGPQVRSYATLVAKGKSLAGRERLHQL